MPQVGHLKIHKNFYKRKRPKLLPRSSWLSWRDSNPRDDGVKVRCLTAWRQLIIKNKNRI